MKNLKKIGLCSMLAMMVAMPAYADELANIIDDGKFFGEFRYRYETVEQDGFNEDARASTVRTNLGFKTGEYHNFKGLAEVQIVQNVGANDFNDTTNGNTNFPVVADPDVAELNRAWIAYDGIPDSVIKVGRHNINLDNQRFVGTVGWRQNDQTFDGVRVTNDSIKDVTVDYNYVQNVNRIFGDDANLGDLSSKVHLANISYKPSDAFKASIYGYLMEFDRLAAQSNATYGLRLTGKFALDDSWNFAYEAEYAKQSDHGNSTLNYDEDYIHASAALSGYGAGLKLGYEELGGDGTNAFRTPLATLHKFNGWADKFLATPNQGLKDMYASASYKFNNTGTMFDGLLAKAIYHKFDGDSSGDFGSEVDLLLKKTFTLPDQGQSFRKFNVALKYSDYNAEDAPYTDTQKFWAQIGMKF